MNANQKGPRAYLGMLVICLAGLLLLALGGIYPAHLQIDRAEQNVANLRAEVEKQQALLPVYVALIQQKERPLYESLPVPGRSPLLVEGLADLPHIFEGIARDAGLQLVSATPQVRSLRDGHEALRVDARVRGSHSNMKTLLLRLGEQPYVERIETLSIEVLETGREMRLTLWIGIG